MSGFESMYREAQPPPWDTGAPQSEVVHLQESGRIEGSVLDVGCGTGENSLYLAAQGHPVVGIDAAPTAIARARAKATTRKVDAMFHVSDALSLDPGLGSFRSLLDSGLFHTWSDEERPRYAASLARLAHSGARLFVLCFSDREPPGWGPRRIPQADIGPAFAPHWKVHEIHPARFDTVEGPKRVHAWRAELHRV